MGKEKVMAHLSEPMKPKPSIYLSDADARKFDDFDVDEEFDITATVRVSSKSKRSYTDEEGNIQTHNSIDLELSSIRIKKDSPTILMSNRD